MFAIKFRPAARREMKRVPRPDLVRIARRIDDLARDPHPQDAVKLKARDDTYRVRVGDYRVFYQIDRAVLIVLIVRVAHRQSAYRKA